MKKAFLQAIFFAHQTKWRKNSEWTKASCLKDAMFLFFVIFNRSSAMTCLLWIRFSVHFKVIFSTFKMFRFACPMKIELWSISIWSFLLPNLIFIHFKNLFISLFFSLKIIEIEPKNTIYKRKLNFDFTTLEKSTICFKIRSQTKKFIWWSIICFFKASLVRSQ